MAARGTGPSRGRIGAAGRALEPVLFPERLDGILDGSSRLSVALHGKLHGLPCSAMTYRGRLVIDRFAVALLPTLASTPKVPAAACRPEVVALGVEHYDVPTDPGLHRLGRAIPESEALVAQYQDEALAWADTSMSVFADRHRQLVPVRARRADLLRQVGDEQAVVDMYRESFEATPTPETFRLFVEAAPRPTEARRKAIDHVLSLLPMIDDEDGEPAEPTIGRPITSRAATGAVAVLLAAGDDHQAWSVALVHGATDSEWRRMAEQRQISDPESAISVMALETERAIERKDRSGYRTAVQLLERIERLATKANKPELHRDLVDEITIRHHRKSSLMALLRAGN